MRHLNELERQGLMSWRIEEHAWVADPDRVVRAFTDDGTLEQATRELDERGYRTHEFGDSCSWSGGDARGETGQCGMWLPVELMQRS